MELTGELTIGARLAEALTKSQVVLMIYDGERTNARDVTDAAERLQLTTEMFLATSAGQFLRVIASDMPAQTWLSYPDHPFVGIAERLDADLPDLREALKRFDHQVIRIDEPAVESGSPIARRQLAGYQADTDAGHDRLGISPDVDMLADLVASRLIRPPLSIGLFGNWGSGKSFFMRQLRERVRTLADAAAAEETARGKQGPEISSYCSSVRQITFNAWHYAEANLWASLAAHIFDNLASEGSENDLERRAHQLAKLRTKETSLLTQLSAARLERMLVAAQHQREPFTFDLTHDDFHWVGKAFGVPEASIDQVREFAKGMLGWRAKVRQALSLFRHSKLAWILLGSGIALTVGIVVLLRSPLWPAITALISTVVAAVTPFAREVHKAASRIKVAADTKKASTGKRLADLDAETQRLERAVAELAPGRDATAFAQSRQASDDYRQHLGVVSLLRRDLETFAAILDEERESDGGLERIVLYVDDLDRCPPDVVVKVLEAIHLLVALPVFVVVVGVDARWLREAIRRHYETMLTEGVLTPANYLEKIFQIPFQLSTMDPSGFGDLVRSLAATVPSTPTPREAPAAERLPGPATNGDRPATDERPAADGDRAATDGEQTTAGGERPASGGERAATEARAGTAGNGDRPAAGRPQLETAARTEVADLRPRQLEISAAELDFLCRLAPLVPSPRAAKRLINLYRLLRARLSGPDLDAFVDGDGASAVLVLLAVHADEGSSSAALFHRIGAAGSGLTSWRALLDRYREDDDVESLCAQLVKIDGMPDTLAVYREWLPLVRRFSFGH